MDSNSKINCLLLCLNVKVFIHVFNNVNQKLEHWSDIFGSASDQGVPLVESQILGILSGPVSSSAASA